MQFIRRNVKGVMHNKKGAGFTLIEMAVVIMIIGFLSVAFSQAYNLREEDTVVDVKGVNSAIAGFRATYGRYPCPASLTVTPDDPFLGNTYGRESDCADEVTIAPGMCVEGICVQESMRPITFTSGGTVVGPAPVRVRVGAVPFRQLNLEEENAFDGYGNRLLYVVTERLAVADRFDPRNGGVSIINQEDGSAIEPPDSAHFMVLSRGANEQGAFTRQGRFLNCDIASSEGSNCDINCGVPLGSPPGTPAACTISAEAQYRSAERNESEGNEYFDDVLDYFLEAEIPLWQTSEDDNNDIHQKPTGNVGFFVNTGFSMDERGEVEGDVRAFDNGSDPFNPGGAVMLDRVCSQDGTDCFSLTKITGDPVDSDAARRSLNCPPDTYMVEISSGDQRCVPEVELRCPAGRYLVGINGDGSLDCDTPPPPGCDTQEVGICGTTRWLPPTPHNGRATVTAGTSREEEYRCRNGNWSLIDTQGSCTCTPGVVRTRGGLRCSTGFTGTYTSTETRVCPSGDIVTTNNRATACVCADTSQTGTQSCPSGQSGSISRVRYWTCTSPTTGSWGDWIETSDTCACNPTTQEQRLSCPSGYTGFIRQERDRECPSGRWTAWRDVENTCACTPRTDERTVSCPTGYQGEIVQRRNLTCPDGTWSSWTDHTNTCEPIPPRICNWNPVSAPRTGQTNSQGENISSSCECGTRDACYRRITPGNFTVYMQCNCD